jgi:flagellar protein FliO/FliZ
MDLLPESLPLRFSLAFLIVLGIIGLGAWAVRRFGAARLGGAGARGRQPRLGVIDYASVDARRRLILIRRDNVEHLLMIGGPTDVVVEANIVRAAAASRDVPTGRPAALETLSRAIPLPDNGDGSWPLQPESVTPSAPPARATPKTEPAAEEAPAWPLQRQAETPPARPQRDTLAALADELSARPSPPPPPARGRPSAGARAPIEPRGEPRMPAGPQSPAPTSADAAAADQSLAEMAHRLEAALRKPGAPADARAPAAPQRQPAQAEHAAASEPAAPPPPPRMGRPAAAPSPQNAQSQQDGQSPTLYDNLEQEMASLLGRPTNKS